MHPWKYLFSSDRSQRLRTSEFADAEKWQEFSMFAHWECKARALQRVDYWSLLKIRYSSSSYSSPVKYSLQNFSQFLARAPCCFRVFLSAEGCIPVSTSINVSSSHPLNCYNPGVFLILKNQHYRRLISQLQGKKTRIRQRTTSIFSDLGENLPQLFFCEIPIAKTQPQSATEGSNKIFLPSVPTKTFRCLKLTNRRRWWCPSALWFPPLANFRRPMLLRGSNNNYTDFPPVPRSSRLRQPVVKNLESLIDPSNTLMMSRWLMVAKRNREDSFGDGVLGGTCSMANERNSNGSIPSQSDRQDTFPWMIFVVYSYSSILFCYGSLQYTTQNSITRRHPYGWIEQMNLFH
jgi:hypothetical protein